MIHKNHQLIKGFLFANFKLGMAHARRSKLPFFRKMLWLVICCSDQGQQEVDLVCPPPIMCKFSRDLVLSFLCHLRSGFLIHHILAIFFHKFIRNSQSFRCHTFNRAILLKKLISIKFLDFVLITEFGLELKCRILGMENRKQKSKSLKGWTE